MWELLSHNKYTRGGYLCLGRINDVAVYRNTRPAHYLHKAGEKRGSDLTEFNAFFPSSIWRAFHCSKLKYAPCGVFRSRFRAHKVFRVARGGGWFFACTGIAVFCVVQHSRVNNAVAAREDRRERSCPTTARDNTPAQRGKGRYIRPSCAGRNDSFRNLRRIPEKEFLSVFYWIPQRKPVCHTLLLIRPIVLYYTLSTKKRENSRRNFSRVVTTYGLHFEAFNTFLYFFTRYII